MKRVVAAAAVVLALAGCSSVKEGTVVDKSYRESSVYPQVITVPQPNGGITTTTTMQYVPECYSITLDNGEDRDSRCVKEDFYFSVNVGDYINLDG